MKVLHVIPAFRDCDGGPPRSVGGLCGALAETNGIESQLLFGEDDPSTRAMISEAVGLHPIPTTFGKGFARFKSHGYNKALKAVHNKEKFDIIHSHGMWLKSNHEISLICRQLKIPIIISPRGMFPITVFQ